MLRPLAFVLALAVSACAPMFVGDRVYRAPGEAPEPASRIEDVGPWRYGMTLAEAQSFTAQGPYTRLESGSLIAERGNYRGEARRVFLGFDAGVLENITIWTYEGEDDAAALRAIEALFDEVADHGVVMPAVTGDNVLDRNTFNEVFRFTQKTLRDVAATRTNDEEISATFLALPVRRVGGESLRGASLYFHSENGYIVSLIHAAPHGAPVSMPARDKSSTRSAAGGTESE